MIPRKGFLWQSYGFTKLHIWGVYTAGGFLGAVGTIALMFSIFAFFEGRNNHLLYAALISGAAFLGAISVVLASLFTLVFYLGAYHLNLLEKETSKQSEPDR